MYMFRKNLLNMRIPGNIKNFWKLFENFIIILETSWKLSPLSGQMCLHVCTTNQTHAYKYIHNNISFNTIFFYNMHFNFIESVFTLQQVHHSQMYYFK